MAVSCHAARNDGRDGARLREGQFCGEIGLREAEFPVFVQAARVGDVQPRAAGKSKFSMKSLFKFALNNITSFTNVPIHLITWVGVIFFRGSRHIFQIVLYCLSKINVLCRFMRKWPAPGAKPLSVLGQAAEGFSTVILLILITGACILLGVGVIGYYLSKIYEEIKQRPRYIISRTAGGKGSDNGN